MNIRLCRVSSSSLLLDSPLGSTPMNRAPTQSNKYFSIYQTENAALGVGSHGWWIPWLWLETCSYQGTLFICLVRSRDDHEASTSQKKMIYITSKKALSKEIYIGAPCTRI